MDFDRDTLLTMSDEALSARCRISFCKGSGPGGQKRNKTSSMVKVELPELNLAASDCTERSQFRNREKALKKLKMLAAINFRRTDALPPENMNCSMDSARYPLFAARLLDVLKAKGFDCRQAAEACAVSPSALLKKIFRDPQLLQYFQEQRRRLELPELHPPR